MSDAPVLKPLYWVGSSKRDFKMLPARVMEIFGYGLYLAQVGGKHEQAKVLKGFGSAGVLELIEDWQGSTYRAVYTVRFAVGVFARVPEEILERYCFPKERSRPDSAASEARRGSCKGAREMKRRKGINRIPVERGSGNVYADMGLPHSEDMLLKAQLVNQIAAIIQQRRLTQSEAAQALRLTQPRISRMLRGEFRGISERRLLRCLTRLGRDVEIVVKRAPVRRSQGKLTIHFA